MKKLIFGLIFFFNILPFWKDDKLSVFQLSQAHAQVGQAQLNNWLQSQYPNATVQNAPNSTSVVYVHLGNNTILAYNVAYTLVNSTGGVSGYYQPGFSNNVVPSMPQTPPLSNNATPEGSEDQNEQEWAEFNLWMSEVNMQNYMQQQQDYQDWVNENSYGWETSGPSGCDGEGTYGVGGSTAFFLAVTASEVGNDCVPIPSGLPCANKFLYGNKVISFNSSQQSGITCYYANDGAINGVQYNNQKYTLPKIYDVIENYQNIEYFNSCGEKIHTVETVDIRFVNPRLEIKFTNFAALDAANPLPSGITKVIGKDAQNQPITGYTDIPANLTGITFSLDPANVRDAIVGEQVLALKKSVNNAPATWYCLTIMPEDITRGLDKDRDKKYIPESVNLHLEYPVNLPSWVRELLSLLPDLMDDCTVSYINDKLDALHASPAYQALPTDDLKRTAEYKSLGYNVLFGYFYCQTNEQAAKDMSCAGQYAMGMLHEVIASVDIAQMTEGLIKIVEGLGSMVAQNIKNIIDAAKDASENETTIGTFNYERFTKFILERNVQDAEDFYAKAESIAENFKNVYFTNCDATPVGSLTYNMCCYRRGEITMMVLPIILTAGDYAVVKLTGLAAKYGNLVNRAVKMLDDAERLGAHIVQDGTELLIKESDEVEAFIISKQEKVGNDVIITGEQDLALVIDEGDLIDEIKTPPAPPVNNVITETPGNKTNKWNKKLNGTLEANKEYHVGNHVYKTDGQGRVNEVTCNNLQKIQRDRNQYQQTVKSKAIKNGQTGDQGGHLIGSQFDGAGEQINLVPMKSSINQSPGSYASMEQQWANTITNGGTITNVKIEIAYGANNRPISFTVTADVNGIPQQWLHNNL